MSIPALALNAFHALAGLAAAMLALAFARIARFYQQTSGERTRYRLFAVPALLLVLAGITSTLGQEKVSAALWLAGGGSLIRLAFLLNRQMTGRSK